MFQKMFLTEMSKARGNRKKTFQIKVTHLTFPSALLFESSYLSLLTTLLTPSHKIFKTFKERENIICLQHLHKLLLIFVFYKIALSYGNEEELKTEHMMTRIAVSMQRFNTEEMPSFSAQENNAMH